MQDLPHRYSVTASADGAKNVILSGAGLPDLPTAGPPQFGGPGDVWSPETLLVGAIADCFILTFRAIARKAKLEWSTLTCTADGTLDKVDGFNQFTAFRVEAELTVAPGTNENKALTILHKAEKYCLITHSLKAEATLEATVTVGEPVETA